MIHHISFSALDPHHVAQVMGQLFGAPVIPAPPAFPQGSYFVPMLDDHGSNLEIVPHGTVLRAGEAEGVQGAWVPAVEGTFNPNHALISTHRSVEELLDLGTRQGWRTLVADRGPFQLVEMWIENRQMMEFVTQDQLRVYRAFMQAVANSLPRVPPGTLVPRPGLAPARV
ncbi:MAG TPA: hypothetical protein VJ570_07545 [Holophagaceae bacterium]|nr:hypothetical protein [Holophagaceae bacterium]